MFLKTVFLELLTAFCMTREWEYKKALRDDLFHFSSEKIDALEIEQILSVLKKNAGFWYLYIISPCR